MNPSPEIWAISGSVIGLLLYGNIFFIKRLIDKLEMTVKSQETTTVEVSRLNNAVSGMGDKLREIKSDLKELSGLKIDVAVISAQMNLAKTETLGQN